MSARGHIGTLLIATAAWLVFWLAGLPSYYQQYSRGTMIAVCVILLPPIVVISYYALKRAAPGKRISRAAWLAFYFSVPIAFYDWVYCGIHLGYGAMFAAVFWYLTLYYIVPWIVLPATAIILNQREIAVT